MVDPLERLEQVEHLGILEQVDPLDHLEQVEKVLKVIKMLMKKGGGQMITYSWMEGSKSVLGPDDWIFASTSSRFLQTFSFSDWLLRST